MRPEFIELTYAGDLQLEKVLLKVASISALQKPKSNEFGCIVKLLSQTYPVKESYDELKKLLLNERSDGDEEDDV